MKKKSKTEDDFHQAMRGVKRLTPDKILLRKPNIARNPSAPPAIVKNHEVTVDHWQVLPPVSDHDYLFFARSGLQSKVVQGLKKGKYPIDACLDLHGLSRSKAHVILLPFLSDARANNAKIVLVIHGKGSKTKHPVLKNWLNQTLKEIDFVLAFCSARVVHGGLGAVYVLIKRNETQIKALKKEHL